MRNLKRALSLALASVMLLGMMVVGTSAASYPDVDKEDNIEAIEVLNAVQVMIGDNGNFNPDKAVNRHEMAVIMAKLVLGNETADNYVGTHPFTDVVPWADKYVAACYENGLVAGTSATTFGGGQPLTAVQAAAMMLRALGYKDLSKNATDWRAPVTAAANRIRLFAGVASNPSQQLTRNQVAQLALNTLKSPMVDTKDNTLSITGGSGDNSFSITGGGMEYVVRSSTNTQVSGAILRTEVGGNGADGLSGYALELGEHLYNGKLRLTNSFDDFGRPSRHWEYDGKAIGDYAKKELVRATYTAGKKGYEIYNDIGSEACNYPLDYWVDGVQLTAAQAAAEQAKLGRRATATDVTVGPASALSGRQDDSTGRGVQTEVYVDTQNQQLTIVEIHTYLAQAIVDYDAKNERITINVYIGRDSNGAAITVSKRLELEDLPNITGYKKDDYMMVAMAGTTRDVTSVADPAVVSDVYVSAYSSKPVDPTDHGDANGRLTQVTADGKVYKTSAKAYYDADYLFDYHDNRQQLDGYRYDLFLDEYGYVLGIKNVTAAENTFFVVGYEKNSSYWGSGAGKARVIFPDGTMSEVNVKGKNNFGITLTNTSSGAVNAWYDYTVDSNGVYVISGLTNRQFAEFRQLTTTTPKYEGGKVNSTNATMSAGNVTGTITDNHSYVVRNDATAPAFVYGNDNSVYIAVKEGKGVTANRIDEVNGVTTGIKNVNIDPKGGLARFDGVATTAVPNVFNTFGLYDKNGYVTYAVVIGEDGSVADNMVYLTSGITGSYYDSDIKEYVYQYDAIVKDSDEVVTVNSLVRWATNGSAVEDKTQPLTAHSLYKASYDAKGFITKMDAKNDSATNKLNTQAYKDEGYGKITVSVPSTTDVTRKITLGGNTLYLNPDNNDEYTLITGDTRFFVNGKDDTDGKYNLYATASSALAALGYDNKLTSTYASTGDSLAKFVAICDTATGYAKTVIFLDYKYEDNGAAGGPVDGKLSTAYIYNNGSDASPDWRVKVEMTANVSTNTIYNYRVIRQSIDTGYETIAATGSITVTAGTSNAMTGVAMSLAPATYYVEINGYRYMAIPVR